MTNVRTNQSRGTGASEHVSQTLGLRWRRDGIVAPGPNEDRRASQIRQSVDLEWHHGTQEDGAAQYSWPSSVMGWPASVRSPSSIHT